MTEPLFTAHHMKCIFICFLLLPVKQLWQTPVNWLISSSQLLLYKGSRDTLMILHERAVRFWSELLFLGGRGPGIFLLWTLMLNVVLSFSHMRQPGHVAWHRPKLSIICHCLFHVPMTVERREVPVHCFNLESTIHCRRFFLSLLNPAAPS